jgi:hypothetical protein
MFYKFVNFIAFLSLLLPAKAQLTKANGHLVAGNVQVPVVNPDVRTSRERNLHYQAQGTDFVTVNGKMRFNRALYGTNTGFRIEAGDLPEFALYMPGMGGNFRFGLIAGNNSKWLTEAKYIKATYRAGSMLYEVKDPLLGNGTLQIVVLALADTEGMIIKTQFVGTTKAALCWVFGGASGKKFSRDGDIGADPESSFYLQPDYCKDNVYTINKNSFKLQYGANNNLKRLAAVMPPASVIRITDAAQQDNPLALYQSNASASPAIAGKMPVAIGVNYFLIQPADTIQIAYNKLAQSFNDAETARKKAAGRIKVVTPDSWINTLGGALSVAADAIWESPTYLHGAVAWRMRLPAWRGAYVADALGWHDRARTHFSSYALSQVTTPETGPVVFDTALHLARQLEKMGTSMFSSGYICRNPNGDMRPHHYDMNLVFIDQLLTHFYYTGDSVYIKQQWPTLQRHLAWEKRNYDADNDGLYDAYCCIWASDALQYSGGGVTHSSAYNYRANAVAAQLAPVVGEDPAPYLSEANKIFDAVNNQLWMPELGWYAEYKDALGEKLLHPAAGLWTIYHAIDEKLPDGFKAYQALRYVDKSIPHIPVQAKGLRDTSHYLLSTTNWQPYTWSLNNVVLAENLHTALAYWQGNRSEDAYRLWKSALVESMYLSSSPGGFEQLSFYDAIRGELYRDFADPIGMAARSLTEGLFGILPDALKDTLTIKPGWPTAWNMASLQTPDIAVDFKRTATADQYMLKPSFPRSMNLRLQIRAWKDLIESVTVNGQPVPWHGITESVGEPVIEIATGKAKQYTIVIKWAGTVVQPMRYDSVLATGAQITAATPAGFIQSIYDPQQVLQNIMLTSNQVQATIQGGTGNKTAFIQLRQGEMVWWFPLCFEVKQPVEIIATNDANEPTIQFRIKNRGAAAAGKIIANTGGHVWQQDIQLPVNAITNEISIPAAHLVPGSNRIRVEWGEGQYLDTVLLNWQIAAPAGLFEKIDISKYFNDKVTNIFKQTYLSPRPKTTTLQLSVQGIGNWCYPLIQPVIDDAGLRKAAVNNEFVLSQHIAFATPADTLANNIVFTSKWDNYPDSVVVPLSGHATHAYYLLAGSTNPMQTRLVNGVLRVHYKDGTVDTLALVNPQNWWPIEQDYFIDGVSFTTGAPRPLRVQLKTGKVYTNSTEYTSIKGFSNMAIDGGAATILDMPLDHNKELESVSLHTFANDVVIGLMSVSLAR